VVTCPTADMAAEPTLGIPAVPPPATALARVVPHWQNRHMFSLRSQLPTTPNTWGQLLERMSSEARVVDLTSSNPTAVGVLPGAREALAALAAVTGTEYRPEPFGLAEAREVAAATQVTPWPRERTFLTASTSETYSFLLRLLCDPGDDILVSRPGYPLLDELARLDGVTLRHYQLAYDGAWHLDLDSVARAIGPRTKAIVVVHPNNPTGHYLTIDEAAALSQLGLPLISDEVFRLYALGVDAARAQSLLGLHNARVFCLDGLSKRAALPQLKLGWCSVSGPDEWVDESLRRLENIADSYLSVATPIQLALSEVLRHSERSRLALLSRIGCNRARACAALSSSPATLLQTEGGWYALVRLPATRGIDDWVLKLAGAGVLVQPGWLFDLDGCYVVLSLIVEESLFARGVELLAQCASET
jgi:alanine-synthesizing transaminase